MVKTQRWGKIFKDKRDWKKYNEELIIRGEFYFDFDFLDNWDSEIEQMNKGKVGHPYEYPNSLFEYLSPLYSFLDSRKLEGALRRLSRYIKKLKACDHSTIIERLNKLNTGLDLDKSRTYNVISDSTGNKLTNRGEYIRHKWKVHRGWIKVSIIVDRKTKDLLDVEVSLEETTDEELAIKHLENLEDIKIERFYGDGAYYREQIYEILKSKDIVPVIKTRNDACTKGFDPMHTAAREIKELGGYKPWRDKYKYGDRWHVEGKISSTKRCNGECVRMINEKNFLKEAKMKFINYERMRNYAREKVSY